MSDAPPPRLGEYDNIQRYSERDLAKIARAARPHVRGEKDAGKVYCPCCRLREARWKRSIEAAAPQRVSLLVYCTQCHKTGVTAIDFARRRRGRVIPILILVALLIWLLIVS